MIVIYHAGCADGFCAAWLLHKAFPDATFHPANYGTPPPDVTGQDVIIADFSYKRPVMIEIIKAAKWVVVLDHHKTAAAELEGLRDYPNTHITFDMDHSGGKITANYLLTRLLIDSDAYGSWLVDYTQDRDLWTWEFWQSKAVNAGIAAYKFDFAIWDELDRRGAEELAVEGNAILRYQEGIIEGLTEKAEIRRIAGHEVPVLNTTTLISEIGNVLSKSFPFSATYFDRQDGQRVWSLRSQPDGLDVSVIAKSFGGGGHPRAAGFQQDIDWEAPQPSLGV